MVKKMLHNIWLFIKKYKIHVLPAILIIILGSLVVLKINGSSIGVYHTYLYGDKKDSNLLYGTPRPIRSDEWLVTTQMTVAQFKNDFKMINDKSNSGQDLSVLMDLPYRDWSAIFKPENLSFFVLPLENAFAFKWWFMIALLAISSYYFFLNLLNKKILLAALFTILISFSPFVFWWYQSTTILPFAYGFLIILLGMSIIDRRPLSVGKLEIRRKQSIIIKILLLSYVLTAFALVFYPPFQICVGLGISAFLLGYLLNNSQSKHSRKTLLAVILPLAISITLALALCVTFILTRFDTIQAILNTAYPGQRTVVSGDYNPLLLMTNYLQPLLQDNLIGGNFFDNQSASSSFIMLPLFYILPGICILINIYRSKRRIDWILAMMILINLTLIAHLILPIPPFIAHILLLDIVPTKRAIAGIGFCGIIMISYIIHITLSSKRKNIFQPLTPKYMLCYAIVFLVMSILAGIMITKIYPDFIQSKKLVVILAMVVVAGMYLSLTKKSYLGLIILSLFSIISIINVNPLYRGLNVLVENPLSKAIAKNSNKDSIWVSANDLYLENIPLMHGARSVTGVASYPNIKFWKEYAGSDYDFVYNRYAHIVGSSQINKRLILNSKDVFFIQINCTSQLMHIANRIITALPLNTECTNLLDTVYLPERVFYIYEIK